MIIKIKLEQIVVDEEFIKLGNLTLSTEYLVSVLLLSEFFGSSFKQPIKDIFQAT
ncbi:33045_t:CDS:2 [Gigaspora margarita]|uniref:33045_t:CDS:1 n=1 Tax=Gigaspora margarita TaxID=4874 RepID=A0ABN7UHC9_GIGMA|nr:33045_t:CDS:2 [Gigaspora margarita]